MSHQHVDPVKDYALTFFYLLVLLVVTVLVARFTLNPAFLNILVAMIIAAVKAILVIRVFMGMRHTTKLTQVWAFSGIIFFATMIAISLSDYFSRH